MKHPRKWEFGQSYGYSGTDSKDVVDLIDDLGFTEEDLDAMTLEELQAELSDMAREQACERVESWAEPVEEDNEPDSP